MVPVLLRGRPPARPADELRPEPRRAHLAERRLHGSPRPASGGAARGGRRQHGAVRGGEEEDEEEEGEDEEAEAAEGRPGPVGSAGTARAGLSL